MDIKKTAKLSDKVKFFEMMINKVESSIRAKENSVDSDGKAAAEKTSACSSANSCSGLSFLKKAAHLLEEDAERLQIDVDILKRNAESAKSNT